MSPDLTAVVPTLGRSPLLRDALLALRQQQGVKIEIVLVAPEGREGELRLPPGAADQVLLLAGTPTFAAATNAGIQKSTSPLIATVNDDVLVQPGWAQALGDALGANPGVAMVQGVNLLLENPDRADGWGLGWNRAWQAVQLGHGEASLPADGPPREIFGVSATAALYRRQALEAVARRRGEFFDLRLGSYYEDVDLAGRLRGAGYGALAVPRARALHAGSATGSQMGFRRQRWIYGNRYLVVAWLLGRTFWGRVPAMAYRDLRDLARYVMEGSCSPALGILAGWTRAVRHLPAFAHLDPPRVSLSELARFSRAD